MFNFLLFMLKQKKQIDKINQGLKNEIQNCFDSYIPNTTF